MNDELPIEPITEEQWIRILGDRKFRVLVKPEQQEWAGRRAVRCINCEHASDAGGDPWRAWCVEQRCMVSNSFPVLCRKYLAEGSKDAASQVGAEVKPGSIPLVGPAIAAPPRPHQVRDASMIAYRALEWSGRMTRQQKLVMDFFAINPQRDYTRQELANALELGINVICGRVNELRKPPFALLEELDRRECRITGESAHPLRATSEASRASHLAVKEAA